MDTTSCSSEHPAPFQRPMAVARLRRDVETPFRISAEAAELAALADYLDVDRIDRLSLAGFISPIGKDGWRVRGRLVAKIEQSCVVTLAPVRSRHDAEVERQYLPARLITPEHEVLVSLDDEDLPDPFTDTIDPAQLAVEILALSIDPYPRSEGAELGQRAFAAPGITPLSDEASRPFASLAALKSGTGENK
jgi:uncharacterized metal-binding protein YceD (DUF177 family)